MLSLLFMLFLRWFFGSYAINSLIAYWGVTFILDCWFYLFPSVLLFFFYLYIHLLFFLFLFLRLSFYRHLIWWIDWWRLLLVQRLLFRLIFLFTHSFWSIDRIRSSIIVFGYFRLDCLGLACFRLIFLVFKLLFGQFPITLEISHFHFGDLFDFA